MLVPINLYFIFFIIGFNFLLSAILLLVYGWRKIIGEKFKLLSININRRQLNALFFLFISVNVVLNIALLIIFRVKLSDLRNAGMNMYGSLNSVMGIKFIDAFCCICSLVVSIASFAVGLLAMSDKKEKLTELRAAYIIAAFSCAEAVVFSDSLLIVFFFLLMMHGIAHGIYHADSTHNKKLMPLVLSALSRGISLLLFLIGVLMLLLAYNTDTIPALLINIKGTTYDKVALSLMIAPLTTMFVKPFPRTNYSVYRGILSIRSLLVIYVLTRIIFSLYGPLSDIDKLPNLYIMLGVVMTIVSLLMLVGRREPNRFTENMELYTKGFIMVSMGLSMGGLYAAEKMSLYGISAFEGFITFIFLYVPLSLVLSMITCYMKTVTESGHELWEDKGSLNKSAFCPICMVILICCFAGMPPFVGYAAKQFVYRASNFVSPFLSAFLFITSVAMFFLGVRFCVFHFFCYGGDYDNQAGGDIVNVRRIVLPVCLLMLLILVFTLIPGSVHEKIISPCAEALMSAEARLDSEENF